MRDFTLDRYWDYLDAVKQARLPALCMRDLLAAGVPPPSFCAIRHDVDRRPRWALRMALGEHERGVRATYYFRSKPRALDADVVRAVADMGHEVGYHFECLSDARGDRDRAVALFTEGLAMLRDIAPVSTVSMHGRPLSGVDNRDLWRGPEGRRILRERFGILGEAYLHLDYAEIAYVSDTGRTWHPTRFNRRDRVPSRVTPCLASGTDLLEFLRHPPVARMVLQVHPERWAASLSEWLGSLTVDVCANAAKVAFAPVRGFWAAPAQRLQGGCFMIDP